MNAARWRVIAALATLTAVFAARAADPPPEASAAIHLQIRVDRAAPSWAGDELRQELRVAAARENCPIQLKVVPDDAPADLTASIRIAAFTERSEPGGAAILDPQTGRQRPGKFFFAEARWGLELFAPGDAKPIFEHVYTERASAATTPNPGYDPRREARRSAVGDMSERIVKVVCKTVRKLR